MTYLVFTGQSNALKTKLLHNILLLHILCYMGECGKPGLLSWNIMISREVEFECICVNFIDFQFFLVTFLMLFGSALSM